MSRCLRHLLLVLAFSMIAPAAAPAAAVPRVNPAVTLDVLLPTTDGDRSYRLHVPPFVGVRPARPLVVALHGSGGDGAAMERDTGLSAVADRLGFAVAYPSAIDSRWNDGRLAAASPDDVAFIDAVVADAAGRVPITRVFAAGMSGGGFMTVRLACERAGAYAGFAVVDASLPANLQSSCDPPVPPRLVLINGDADPILPFAGGAMPQTGQFGGGQVLGGRPTVDYFAEQAGCPPQWQKSRSDAVSWDGTALVTMVPLPCRGEPVNVKFLKVVGGGHTWPGRPSPFPAWLVGRTSYELSASQEILQFFAALP